MLNFVSGCIFILLNRFSCCSWNNCIYNIFL